MNRNDLTQNEIAKWVMDNDFSTFRDCVDKAIEYNTFHRKNEDGELQKEIDFSRLAYSILSLYFFVGEKKDA